MRTNWKNSPKLFVVLLVLFLIAGLGGITINLVIRHNSSFRNLSKFPTSDYRQNKPIWGNSSYRLSGTLDNIIMESKQDSCYFATFIPQGEKSPLPVIIPASASKTPLQSLQKLSLKVSIDSANRIVASDCTID